ncbi:hypothetical protein SAMN05192551_1118 [Tindallia magadiensis]|uniref:Uncharacterized protein n=1 Tax=Tindallia magadiensis TaxID=69895 RepID=A0A1I3H0R1_9FIRM|nr:hypothetical protein [Tindallia magadiensis]SFI29147.1 hypothetical protein SAMN05192551_1118 [Tindallia magadiensis]
MKAFKATPYDTLTDKTIIIKTIIITLFIYFGHSRVMIDPHSSLGRPPVSDSVRFAILLVSFSSIIYVGDKTIKKIK